jgi:protein-L-isoaspartate(D-aspartate) O-methyltransferase
VGDAAATELFARGEFNLGHLCRVEFGNKAYNVGFGTNKGTVAAASSWDAPMEIKTVLPAIADSYENLCHRSSVPSFFLDLSQTPSLSSARLERAIGVIYRPETELTSHYFQAVLPDQFDEFVWFDKTTAVSPLKAKELEGLPETYPFGL